MTTTTNTTQRLDMEPDEMDTVTMMQALNAAAEKAGFTITNQEMDAGLDFLRRQAGLNGYITDFDIWHAINGKNRNNKDVVASMAAALDGFTDVLASA